MSSLLARTVQNRPLNENRIRGMTPEKKDEIHQEAQYHARVTFFRPWDAGLVQIIERKLISYREMGL